MERIRSSTHTHHTVLVKASRETEKGDLEMDLYNKMYEKARRKNEGPAGREFIAWIVTFLAIPTFAGLGIGKLLSGTDWGSGCATGAGIVIGLLILLAEICWTVWYANKKGWLDIGDEEERDFE